MFVGEQKSVINKNVELLLKEIERAMGPLLFYFLKSNLL